MKIRACLLMSFLALVVGSCAHKADTGRWVREVHESSSMADQALARGDLVAARGILEEMAEKPMPAGLAEQDGLVVRKDACFRLALLELQAEKPEAALAWAERGLGLGEQKDLFTANLLVARGTAMEALGKDEDAAEAYHEALQINEELLDAELKDEGGRVKL